MREALELADVLFLSEASPWRVKHWKKVWGKVDPPPFWVREPIDRAVLSLMPKYPYYVLDEEPEHMPIPEQQHEAAKLIHQLSVFRFLCAERLRKAQSVTKSSP
jgi:hypothetical protein